MQKFKFIFLGLASYIGKKILPTGLVVFGIVWLSFVFTRGYTVTEFSNRMFLVGLSFMVLGTVVVFAQMITGKSMQVFSKEDWETIKKDGVFDLKSNQAKEKSYNVGAQLWWIGTFCIMVSALYDLIF